MYFSRFPFEMELLGGCAMNEINICKEVGAKIRYFRKLQGYTLESFATILHRSKSVLSQYERGEISIDLLTLQQISNALWVFLSARSLTTTGTHQTY